MTENDKKQQYAEKLKDPRWQKKRLKIFERDNWLCQVCYSDKGTLHVHHKVYMKNKEPWEYPDEFLITLCEECHKKEHSLRKIAEKELLLALRFQSLSWLNIRDLALGFTNIDSNSFCKDRDTWALEWALGQPKLLGQIRELHLKTLMPKRDTERDKRKGKMINFCKKCSL